MMKKFAALGLTAALAFAPMVVVAHADDAAPAAPMADTAAPGAEKPMKMHKMKHHMMKKSHKKMMKKMDAPASDAAPAPDAPK